MERLSWIGKRGQTAEMQKDVRLECRVEQICRLETR